MKPFRFHTICCAVVVLLASAESASAAWNNVFQATFFHRNKTSTSQYCCPAPVVAHAAPVVAFSSPVVSVPSYSAPSCDPCPKPQCTTSYVQRCYYQPVTSYTTKTYYEPVTTMQTSYFYEPVTSYKYSCYYDPCSCSYKQVAVPTVSYSLKAKCCPVQSWVQKCAQVPVTTYQQSFYWEPQTTCCSTTVGVPSGPVPAPAPPPPMNGSGGPPPMNGSGGPPPVHEKKTPGETPPPPPAYEKYYGPPVTEGSTSKSTAPKSYWNGDSSPTLGAPQPSAKPLSQPPAATPKYKVPLEKFVSLSGSPESAAPTGQVKGQVVTPGNAPRAHTELVFINAGQKTLQQKATASASGQFNLALTSGQWLVYVRSPNGETNYHSKIEIFAEQPSYITLVTK